jgi:hypothetical protein
MKTNKHKTLLLVKEKGTVRAKDVVEQFDYSSGTARSYLSHLGRQDLIVRSVKGYCLTTKGHDRLRFFEASGCGNPDCPLCERKSGFITCPRCGWRQARDKVRLRPLWDTPFFRRQAGVYCMLCQSQILTAVDAQRIGLLEVSHAGMGN